MLRSISLAILCLAVSAFAQELSQREKPGDPHPLQPYVLKQFGVDFKIDTHFQPFYADVDGDGTEDLILVAFTKHALGGSAGFNYTVVDPYDGYFGVGNPKITTQFATFGDGTNHCFLIVHDWKGEKPKSKWVIVNVPFAKVSVGQMSLKKKTVAAISTVESGGLSGLVYFDGKKYKWQPNEFTDGSEIDLQ